MKVCAAAAAVLLAVAGTAAQEAGYDRQALQRLTEYRQVHRKTLDGRLCAAAFVQDNVTYTDCTASRAPDGTTGRPWCYVEVQLLGKGNRDWDYCQDSVNYDSVRASARAIFHRKGTELVSSAHQMDAHVQRLKDTLHRFREVCTSTDVVGARSKDLQDALRGAQHSMTQLQAGASRIHELQETIMALREDIDADYEKAKNSKFNCEAVRGYDDKPTADGLRASFYNNAAFRGPPVAYADERVLDAFWESASPANGVPYQDFAVRWDGYIVAPVSGKFELVTQADCGVRVFLDGSPVIVDRMPTPTEGSAFSDNPVRILAPTDYTGVKKTYSAPQHLQGGRWYRIRVEYFHLSALKFKNADSAKISLGWRSSSIPEQIIPADSLYKGRPSPALHVSGLPGNTFDMSVLENGVLAFTDSTEYTVADVPPKYEGSKLIRTRTNPPTSDVHFEISTDAYIYAAVPRGGVRPVQRGAANMQPITFEETGDALSVYLVESGAERATQQVPFDIYAARVLAGFTGFSLPYGTSYLIFLSPAKAGEQVCQGESQVVSATGSELFSACTSSSYASGAHDCRAGFSGKNLDLPFGAWRTATGQGLGQYIMVTFTKPVEVTSVQFKPLDDPASWPTEIAIEFPGTREVQKISVQPGDHTYQLVPHVTRSVKATITALRDPLAPVATGGSFAFIGSPCVKAGAPSVTQVRDSVSIVFGGGSSQPIAAGFLLDDGSPKAAHGDYFYGWEHEAIAINPALCQTGSSANGGVAFPEPSCTEADKCNGQVDCNYPNSWSIDMPSYGDYRVTVEVGSPCGGPQINNLYVNGVPFILNEVLNAGQYSKATGQVSLVTSATVTLSSSTRTTMQSIKIEKVKSSLLPFAF